MKSARSDKVTTKPAPHARPFTSGEKGDSYVANQDESRMTGGLVRAWTRFWFTPTDAIGLHVVRVLAGLLMLAWLLFTYSGNLESFVGPLGWVDTRAVGEATRLSEGVFTPGWSIFYLCGTDTALLRAVYWASVAAVFAFTLGIFPRLTAILSWIVVVSLTANPAFEYEGDALLVMLSFYLMIAYVFLNQRLGGQSLLSRLLRPILTWPFGRVQRDVSGEPHSSLAANVAIRLIQVHLALIIVTTGLHKLQFGDWWAGVALWFPLHPPFKTTLADAQVNKPYADLYLSLLNIAAYTILAWQIGFPLFAWRPRWRPVLLGGAVIGWFGAAFVWGLPLIGPALCIGCLSFVTPAGWRKLFALLPARAKEEAASATMQDETASLVTAGQRS